VKKILFVTLLTVISSFAYAEDRTITICSYEWAPHHGKAMNNGGYTAEIIKAIFEPQGYQIEKLFLPWKRALIYAKEGKKCDAITEIYFNEERLEDYWFGSPYSVHEVYTVGLKSLPLKDYDDLTELEDYVIGHNRGGSLSKAFDAADFLQKKKVNGYKEGIEKLLYRQIDLFVSAKSVALYEGHQMGGLDKIRMIGKPLQRQHVHMAFSKNSPQNLIRMQHYNEGLFSLLRSGEYDRIMQRHAFKLTEFR